MAVNVSDIVTQIGDDVRTIVKGEIELAKAELIPSAKNAGIGAGLFGAAAFFGMLGLVLGLVALGLAIGTFFVGLGFSDLGAAGMGLLIVFVVLAAVAGVLALIGMGRMKKITGPEKAQRAATLAVEAAKTGIERGKDNVEAELSRKELPSRPSSGPDFIPPATPGAPGASRPV